MIFLSAIRAVFNMLQVYPEIVVAIFAVLSPYFFSWHSFIQFYFEQDTIFDKVKDKSICTKAGLYSSSPEPQYSRITAACRRWSSASHLVTQLPNQPAAPTGFGVGFREDYVTPTSA